MNFIKSNYESKDSYEITHKKNYNEMINKNHSELKFFIKYKRDFFSFLGSNTIFIDHQKELKICIIFSNDIYNPEINSTLNCPTIYKF